MADKLTITTEKINEGDLSYYWVNIEMGGTRVGKARIRKVYHRLTIKNINIFPEFERRGFAKQIISLFKETAREIIADRVRGTARGFWEKMGFKDKGDGDYMWIHNSR